MKKLRAVLIITVFVSCGLSKNKITDYSNYTISELNSRKSELELKANYVLVNDYLEQIEREEVNHMALTKIDKGILDFYWENVLELRPYCNNWKQASAKIAAFEKIHAPELAALSTQYKDKTIKEGVYFNENRKARARLDSQYPKEYPLLAAKHIKSLKTMWKVTARYMLEDYRRNERLFPIYWIPEKERTISEQKKKYQIINQELTILQNEIRKRV